MTDTTQAPVESPEVDAKTDLAGDAPEQAAAPSEPKPESTDGDDTGAEDQPTTPWWREDTIESEENILSHESLQPTLEERDKSSFEKGRSQTHGRMQGFLEKELVGIQSIDTNVQQFVADFRDLLEDADKDTVKGLNRLLRDHKPTFAALQGLHQQGAWHIGKRDLVTDIGKALGNGDLTSEFGSRLERLSQGDSDPTIYTDLVAGITAVAKASWEKVERPKIEAQVKKRLEAEARNKTRQAGSPPAKPTGGGSGGTETPKPKGQVTGEARADAFEAKHGYRPKNM